MDSKTGCFLIVLHLIGSTLCVIPQREFQIGPLFGPGSKLFGGNKDFEVVFDKAHLKSLLTKKLLLGVGAVGVGALAGGAVLLAKKHKQKGYDGYSHGQYSGHVSSNTGGWYPSSSYDQYSQTLNFPTTDNQYQQQGYPSAGSSGGDYNSAYVDQSTYNSGQNGYYGWSS